MVMIVAVFVGMVEQGLEVIDEDASPSITIAPVVAVTAAALALQKCSNTVKLNFTNT